MTRDVDLIWGINEAEYFWRKDWTAKITLIRFNKIAFWRKSPRRVKAGCGAKTTKVQF
jgi:hypothetical protein